MKGPETLLSLRRVALEGSGVLNCRGEGTGSERSWTRGRGETRGRVVKRGRFRLQ